MSPVYAEVGHFEILVGLCKSSEIEKASIRCHLEVEHGQDHNKDVGQMARRI